MTVDTVGDRFVNHAPSVTAAEFAAAIGEHTGVAHKSIVVKRTGKALAADQTLEDADLRSGDMIRLTGDSPGDDAADPGDSPAANAEDAPLAPATLTMLSGPQAGMVFDLKLGTNSVGRVASNDVVLVDPSISRQHGSIDVRPDRLSVSDRGSTNGIVVDDVHISQTTAVHSGQKILLGQSRASIQLRSATVDKTGDRDLRFRPATAIPRYEGGEVVLPRPPDPDSRAKKREFLIAGRNEHKIALEEFERAFEKLSKHLEAERQIERQARLAESPSLQQLITDLPTRRSLWNRLAAEPGALDVRIGIGTVASRTTFRPPGGGQQDLRTRLAQLAEQYTAVSGAPATVDLRELGSVGIHGPMDQVRGLAYGLVGQLALRLGPDQLGVAVRPSARALEWDWLKWMPHGHFSGSASGLGDEDFEAAVAGLLDGELVSVDGRRPLMLIVIDDDRPLPVAVLTRLLEEGPALGIYSLHLSGANAGFNHPLGAVINVGPERADLLLNNQVRIEGISLETIEQSEMIALGRRIAPLRYAHDADLPAPDDDEDDAQPSVVIGLFELGGPRPPGALPEWRRDVPPPPPEIPAEASAPAAKPPTSGASASATAAASAASAVAAAAFAAAQSSTRPDPTSDPEPAPSAKPGPAPETDPVASSSVDTVESKADDPAISDASKTAATAADTAEPAATSAESAQPAATSAEPAATATDAPVPTTAQADGPEPVAAEPDAAERPGLATDAVNAESNNGTEPVPHAPTMPERPLDIASLPHADEDSRLMLGTVSAPGLTNAAVFALNLGQDGVLALSGASGAGKSTALRSVAAAAGLIRLPANDLPAVSFLDGHGDLEDLAEFDHVAGAGPSNTGRLRSLVSDIGWVVTDRMQKLDGLDGKDGEDATLEQYREQHPDERFRRIVVLVDDLKAVAELVDGDLPGDFEQLFDRLLEHGQRVGIHLVFSTAEPSDLDEERRAKVGRWLELGGSANGSKGQPGRAVVGNSEVRFATVESP